MHCRVHPLWWLPSLTLCTATALGAQGFGLNEIGSCAVARGFAVTGAVCNDPSVIYWNPAAAATLPGGTLSLGDAWIHLNGGFRQDTTMQRFASNVPTAHPPHLFMNYVDDQIAVGLGVYVPYGLTSQWNGDFPGRFEALKASLKTVYIQPNVAYRLSPEWSVGGGVVIGHSSVELIQSLDLSSQLAPAPVPITFGQLGIAAGTEFGRARITGSANAVGVNLGIHGKPAPNWSVGARYLSDMRFSYNDADARFTQVNTGLTLAANNPITGTVTPLDTLLKAQFTGSGPLTPQKAKTVIHHPWQFQGGVGYNGFANTVLSADVARIGWSGFQTLPFTFSGGAAASNRTLQEDYHDIWSYRFGAEHTVQEGSWRGVTLRGGYSYAQSPAPDVTVTPLLPDMPRQNGSVGIGFPMGTGSTVDISYLHVGTPGRRGRIVERTSSSQTAAQVNSGSYDLSANVLSVTLTSTF